MVQDYGDIVVHLFDPETRSYYGLDDLWADATRLDWERLVANFHRAYAEAGNRTLDLGRAFADPVELNGREPLHRVA